MCRIGSRSMRRTARHCGCRCSYLWENDGSNPGGILNLGFTGLMTNGVSNYATLFDPNKMTAGGAAGVVTVDEVSEGDAFGSLNNQEYALQFGLWANPADTGPFFVHTRILAPFAGLTPQNGQSMGMFVGTGDQNNYAKIVLTGNSGGSVTFVHEIGGAVGPELSAPLPMPGPTFVDLYFAGGSSGGDRSAVLCGHLRRRHRPADRACGSPGSTRKLVHGRHLWNGARDHLHVARPGRAISRYMGLPPGLARDAGAHVRGGAEHADVWHRVGRRRTRA